MTYQFMIASGDFNLCVFDEYESDCSLLATHSHCNELLHKNIAAISGMISAQFEETLTDEFKCVLIPLHGTPISHQVFNYLFPKQLSNLSNTDIMILTKYCQDPKTVTLTKGNTALINSDISPTYHAMIVQLFIIPMEKLQLTPQQIAEWVVASDFAAHQLCKTMSIARLLQFLTDRSNGIENGYWSYSCIGLAFWQDYIVKHLTFKSQLDILPYLYHESSEVQFWVIKVNDYLDLIMNEDIQRLQILLTYHNSGAFETFDLAKICVGTFTAIKPYCYGITTEIIKENKMKVLSLFLQPEWRELGLFERQRDRYYETPLSIAVMQNNIQAIEIMMNSTYGPNIVVKFRSPTYNNYNSNGLPKFERGLNCIEIALNEIFVNQDAYDSNYDQKERIKILQLLTNRMSVEQKRQLFDEDIMRSIMNSYAAEWIKGVIINETNIDDIYWDDGSVLLVSATTNRYLTNDKVNIGINGTSMSSNTKWNIHHIKMDMYRISSFSIGKYIRSDMMNGGRFDVMGGLGAWTVLIMESGSRNGTVKFKAKCSGLYLFNDEFRIQKTYLGPNQHIV